VHSGAAPNADTRVARWGRVVLIVGLALYLAVGTFPNGLGPIRPGLDESWMFGFNYLANSSWLFGRDVAFTYGPLTYLLRPRDIGADPQLAVVFWALTQGSLAAVLTYFGLRVVSLLQLAIFTLIVTVTRVLGLSYDSQLLVFGALITTTIPFSPRARGVIVASGAGVLAGVLLYIKFNLGLSVLAALGLSCVILLIKGRGRQQSLAALLSFSASVAILAAVYMRSLSNFILWLRAVKDVVGGYSAAMSIVGPATELNYGIAAICVFVGATVIALGLRMRVGSVFVALLPVAFLAFKEGFVRQDTHVLLYFPLIAALAAVVFLQARGTREVALAAVCVILTVGLAVPSAATYHLLDSGRVSNILLASEGLSNLRDSLLLDTTLSKLRSQTDVDLEGDRLPQSLVEVLRRPGNTVDVLPWEISVIAANRLTWNPLPVVQEYSAYTSYLDNWCAEHFTGKSGPDYVLVQFEDLEGQNLVISSPSMWRAILANYRPMLSQPTPSYLVLERRPSQLPLNLAEVGASTARANAWIQVPASPNLLFAKIMLRQTIPGALGAMAFRVPPLYIRVRYASGRTASFRFIPATAEDGIFANFIPSNTSDLRSLLNGLPTDPVKSLMITGSGVTYYNDQFDVEWWRSSFKVATAYRGGPDLQRLVNRGNSSDFSIDLLRVGDQTLHNPGQPIVVRVAPGQSVTVQGWAADASQGKPAGAVLLRVDDGQFTPATYGLLRSDVATYFKNPRLDDVGYSASLGTEDLKPGEHLLTFAVVSTDGRSYATPPQEIKIDISGKGAQQ